MVEYLEEFLYRHSGCFFQGIGRTVRFQTAVTATITFRSVRVNTDVFDQSAPHMTSLMYFMIGDDRPAEVRIQKEDQSAVKLRMIPEFQIGGSLGIMFQMTWIRKPF